eukprot:COSAG01_NODE_319_length_18909_cov_32.636151_9_plen_112_part_00
MPHNLSRRLVTYKECNVVPGSVLDNAIYSLHSHPANASAEWSLSQLRDVSTALAAALKLASLSCDASVSRFVTHLDDAGECGAWMAPARLCGPGSADAAATLRRRRRGRRC